MGEIWKFVGTPVRIHNHIQITIEGTEPLFTPSGSKLSRVMLQVCPSVFCVVLINYLWGAALL